MLEASILSNRREISPAEKEKNERPAFVKFDFKAEVLQALLESDDDLSEREREFLEIAAKLPESLEFKPGVTIIVGENGSGKTTLAKILHLAIEYDRSMKNQGDDPRSSSASNRFRGETSFEQLLCEAADAFEIAELEGEGANKFVDVNAIAGQVSYYKEDGNFPPLFDKSDTNIKGLRKKLRQNEDVGPINHAIRGSLRQQTDRELVNKLHFRSNGNPGFYFLDEPETGMSPMRQRKIVENILMAVENDPATGEPRFSEPRSVTIVPTNSVKLFESDLPRIDLRFPERGIFRPSEYPPEE